MPGEMTFAINQELLEGGLSVTDEEAKDAMRLTFASLNWSWNRAAPWPLPPS